MSLTALWTIGAAPWVLVLMIVMARTVQPPPRRRVKVSSGHRLRRIRPSQIASTRIETISGLELVLGDAPESPPVKRRTRSGARRASAQASAPTPIVPLVLELDGPAPTAAKRRTRSADPARAAARRPRKPKAPQPVHV